ncbi:MAG: Holliday junction branch migration protein RuvA [Kiloniellales bacterium]
MIGKLTGLVDSSGDDWALIDVANERGLGVGYLVFCSRRTLSQIETTREVVSLLIETHVREDHIHLYGFAERAERDWFRLLSSVQGVGAKMALAVLSVLPPEQLAQAIAAEDKSTITRANGVGPKLAGRIVAELREKAGSIALGTALREATKQAATAASGVAGPQGAVGEDAVSALVNLGYRRVDAFGAVARASRSLGDGATLESLIKAGLKELSA